MSPSYQFQCPACNELIEIEIAEPVCLCDLCFAISGICMCETDCVVENCQKECLRKKEDEIK